MAIENEADDRDVQNSGRPTAQQNMFDGSNGENLDHTDQPMSGDTSTSNAPRSLERLRDRVELAIKELQRLRTENAGLKKQVDALQKQGPATPDGTAVVFSESPEALKAQIQEFIDAIDRLTTESSETGTSE